MWNKRSSVERRQRRRAIFGALLRVCGGVLIVKASLWSAGPTPAQAADRKAAQMAIDANTGAVLHAEAADEPRYPASLTKMMTIYLAFEAIEQGRTSLTRKIKISQEAANAAPSKLDLDPGEEITLGDAIKALVTKSANDVAIAVAEHIAGTEAKFADLMTAKARQLGMARTTFRNASGLPDSGQMTTARDMLTLALRLQDDFPRHYPMFALRTATINGNTYKNHNTMLGQVEGVDGIKTGYTRMSGFNLVTSLRRGDKHVVAAVFGGVTAGVRNMQMRMLLTRSLARASAVKTRRAAPQLVATARPAPRAAPQPVVVAAAPASPVAGPVLAAEPRRAARPVPQPAPQPVEPPVVATATEAAEERPPEPILPVQAQPTIQIARVRPVMVAMRPKPVAAQPVAVDAAAPHVASVPVAVPSPQAPSPQAPSPVVATVAPVPTPMPPTTAPTATRLASPPPIGSPTPSPARPAQAPVRAASVPPVAGKAIAPAPALPAPAPATALPTAPQSRSTTRGTYDAFVPQPGNAPSTLQAQAAALGRGQQPVQPAYRVAAGPGAEAPPQPTFNLRGPLPAAATPAPAPHPGSGGFQIQIGAYPSAAEAERALADVRSRAGDLVKSAGGAALPAVKDNRQIYRARFAGYDARSAAGTCLELRRRQIDCFVMKAE